MEACFIHILTFFKSFHFQQQQNQQKANRGCNIWANVNLSVGLSRERHTKLRFWGWFGSRGMFTSGLMFPPVHFLPRRATLKMQTAMIRRGTWDKRSPECPVWGKETALCEEMDRQNRRRPSHDDDWWDKWREELEDGDISDSFRPGPLSQPLEQI